MHDRAPGDIICMTGCVRDLATAFPDKYDIYVHTTCATLWKNNPYIKKSGGRAVAGMKGIKLDYGKYISRANKHPMHFVAAFNADLSKQLGTYVPVTAPHGDLHLSEWKKQNRPVEGRYWYIITGGKSDFTCKIWSATRWQQSIDMLRQCGLQFVQDGAIFKGHIQPAMDGVLSVVGNTNLRDMMWLIYHSEGVICHVTCAMHMAAALNKPCVVIAGGREHWWWEAYVDVPEAHFGPYAGPQPAPHKFLHTIGLLPCCKNKACWQNKVSKKEQDKHRMYCKMPVDDGYGQLYPKCLDLIQPEHIVEAVMDYHKSGSLKPIGQAPSVELPDGKKVIPGTLSQKPTVAPPPPKKAAKLLDLFTIGVQEEPELQAPPILPGVPTPTVNQFEGLGQKQQQPAGKSIEHPIIGGRMTLCICMYGNYSYLHKQCLNSIISTTRPEHRQIRIACNEVGPETLTYLSDMKDKGLVHKVIVNQDNRKKYPAMRQLFHDASDPITDKWVIWFDDDTLANRDAAWLDKLCQKIINSYPNGGRLFGAQFHWQLTQSQVSWVRSRPWYRNRAFQTRNGREAPNGDHIQFAAGGFWALEMAVIRQAGIPDPEIGQNGGDYMIGQQVWQAGFSHAGWNNGKKFIYTSSVDRRGLEEEHTGTSKWKPGGIFKKMHN